MAKKRTTLGSSTIDGTSLGKFHALSEATDWHVPHEQELAADNPDHREDFEHLLTSAVKGQTAA